MNDERDWTECQLAVESLQGHDEQGTWHPKATHALATALKKQLGRMEAMGDGRIQEVQLVLPEWFWIRCLQWSKGWMDGLRYYHEHQDRPIDVLNYLDDPLHGKSHEAVTEGGDDHDVQEIIRNY